MTNQTLLRDLSAMSTSDLLGYYEYIKKEVFYKEMSDCVGTINEKIKLERHIRYDILPELATRESTEKFTNN